MSETSFKLLQKPKNINRDNGTHSAILFNPFILSLISIIYLFSVYPIFLDLE